MKDPAIPPVILLRAPHMKVEMVLRRGTAKSGRKWTHTAHRGQMSIRNNGAGPVRQVDGQNLLKTP